MSKDTSGPAFPGRGLDEIGNTTVVATGMTLRQWFAGMAMQGMLASWPADTKWHPENTALRAFDFADAMLAHEAKEATE